MQLKQSQRNKKKRKKKSDSVEQKVNYLAQMYLKESSYIAIVKRHYYSLKLFPKR